ncbi:hypothetical protein GH5_02348 [Leishmania sp. Ghana 2012 LV757]|uniref:hypothetical protein n=1 Tax=Leishmania sp. Ghana 2012 LV757 TaxID=2803181 RepID=UPI001B636769|nr:hypothetical protein GH5_02348 [Leishmania sp. Ghana 2012 LV757]
MWRCRRGQGVSSGEGIHHLTCVVHHPCTPSLLSCFTVTSGIACRFCSYLNGLFRCHRSELKRFSHVGDAAMRGGCQCSSLYGLGSSVPVRESEAGITAEWVPDALGYHLPLGLRERREPATKACLTEVAGSKASRNSEKRGTVLEERQVVSSAARDTCTSSQVGSGGHRGGHSDGPPFYGPLPNFATSPVLEWKGCLWQWRPVKMKSAAATLHQGIFATAASMRSDSEDRPSESETQSNAGVENGLAGGATGEGSPDYYLVPFLLCPTLEVLAMQPLMHNSLREELAAAQSAHLHQHPRCPEYEKQCRRGTRRGPVCPELEASPWSISMPTPAGNLAVLSPKCSDGDRATKRSAVSELPTFAMIQGESSRRVGGRVGAWFDHGTAPPTPPEAETWDAAATSVRVERSASEDSFIAPYVHVFCSDTSSACCDSPLSQTGKKALASPTPSSCDLSSPTLPLQRRNAVGGGLAELFLAIDRYAALIARGDLTLSAACWATLCDTKSWWVVQRLRVCSLEVERELLAATEAHKRWQQYALSRNHTLVGKSSHGIYFYDYPFLAEWPG